ncbi:hypothetical protein MTO96_029081 [Rhipicephalus appendiculatus]
MLSSRDWICSWPVDGCRPRLAMTSVEVTFVDIEDPLVIHGASSVRYVTENFQGNRIATCHWQAVVKYADQPSVQVVEGVKTIDGWLQVHYFVDPGRGVQQHPEDELLCLLYILLERQVVVASERNDITPMTLVGVLASAEFTQMGAYSAINNSCQHVVKRLLTSLEVPIPPSLTTLRLLLERAAAEAVLAGTVYGVVGSSLAAAMAV